MVVLVTALSGETSASSVGDLGIAHRASHTRYFNTGTLASNLSDAWQHSVSARTVWHSVSVLSC